MSLQFRTITPDEFIPFARAAAHGFGEQPKDEELEEERNMFDFERSTGVFEDGRVVATGEIYNFEITLPGLTEMRAGGVTWIAVLPTHRRRGILTSIMRQQLQDMRDRGEAIGMLYASESIIYGRFGYGPATFQARYAIDTRHGALASSMKSVGSTALLDKACAREVFPAIYDRYRPAQPGELTRSDSYWDFFLSDPERWHRGASARFYAVHQSESGDPDGYVAYRIKGNWDEGIPNGSVLVGELIGLNPGARAALWDYCSSIDLTRRIETGPFRIDEPVRWMLADGRQLRILSVNDGLWVRVIDIPAALSARRYMVEGKLNIQVADTFAPENNGCYQLDASSDGARCTRTSNDPDLTLSASDLGSLYLGGNRFSTLQGAGRIEERTPGSIGKADSMFASEPTPWCSTSF